MEKIVTFGHPSLNVKSAKIESFDKSLDNLIENMTQIMYEASGVGLAAPQISKNIRLFVYDVSDGAKHCINPKIVKKSGKSVIHEGCLSVPGYYFDIKRSEYVAVESLNKKGERELHEGDELTARVLQHEIDHLNGKLLLSRLRRKDKAFALSEISLKGLPGPYEN